MKYLIILLLTMGAMTSSANAAEVGTSLSTQLTWEWSPESSKAQALDEPHNLSLLWWNLGCGIANAKLTKELKEPDALYTNISALAKSDTGPDIIALGEHCPGRMPQKTKTALENNYAHKFHLEKNNPNSSVRNGILVYSKFPLDLVKKRLLETGDTPKQIEDVTRTYLLLKTETSAGSIYISPLHFYNPWGGLSLQELILSAGGQDNLNYRQAADHMDYLKEDLDLTQDPLLVVGDFNSAKSIYGIFNMAAYSLYSYELDDVGPSQSTFPTQLAKSFGNGYPDVIIDHVFSKNMPLGKTMMLQLKGSDHFPIFYTLESGSRD